MAYERRCAARLLRNLEEYSDLRIVADIDDGARRQREYVFQSSVYSNVIAKRIIYSDF